MRLGRVIGTPCRIEQIGSEPRERRMDRLGARLEQLDHRGIETDGDRAGHLDHESCPSGRAAPGLTRAVAVPGAVHSKMGSQLEAVVEPDQEILADRLDARDGCTDDPTDLRTVDAGPSRADRPADEMRGEPVGGPMEGVALGHGAQPNPVRDPPAGTRRPEPLATRSGAGLRTRPR